MRPCGILFIHFNTSFALPLSDATRVPGRRVPLAVRPMPHQHPHLRLHHVPQPPSPLSVHVVGVRDRAPVGQPGGEPVRREVLAADPLARGRRVLPHLQPGALPQVAGAGIQPREQAGRVQVSQGAALLARNRQVRQKPFRPSFKAFSRKKNLLFRCYPEHTKGPCEPGQYLERRVKPGEGGKKDEASLKFGSRRSEVAATGGNGVQCRAVGRCDNGWIFWPSEGRCFQLYTQGPCHKVKFNC